MDVQVGDVIITKSRTPVVPTGLTYCAWAWILRSAAKKCGHEIMLPRVKIEKNIKKNPAQRGRVAAKSSLTIRHNFVPLM